MTQKTEGRRPRPSVGGGRLDSWPVRGHLHCSGGNMISIGQGAGVAAALCAQLDTLPRELDYRLIQNKLDEMGVSL